MIRSKMPVILMLVAPAWGCGDDPIVDTTVEGIYQGTLTVASLHFDGTELCEASATFEVLTDDGSQITGTWVAGQNRAEDPGPLNPYQCMRVPASGTFVGSWTAGDDLRIRFETLVTGSGGGDPVPIAIPESAQWSGSILGGTFTIDDRHQVTEGHSHDIQFEGTRF